MVSINSTIQTSGCSENKIYIYVNVKKMDQTVFLNFEFEKYCHVVNLYSHPFSSKFYKMKRHTYDTTKVILWYSHHLVACMYNADSSQLTVNNTKQWGIICSQKEYSVYCENADFSEHFGQLLQLM